MMRWYNSIWIHKKEAMKRLSGVLNSFHVSAWIKLWCFSLETGKILTQGENQMKIINKEIIFIVLYSTRIEKDLSEIWLSNVK